jgi:hypothetical protein
MSKAPKPKKVAGLYHFSDFPEFKPNLSPRDIFKAGSFGGTYYRPIHSNITKKDHKDAHLEFPKSWFKGINIETYVTSPKCDKKLNKYGVKSGTSLRYWEQQGWIKEQDPYGWIHWYCRFFLGRRSPDDRRQIDRWLKSVGPNGRFRLRIINMCKKSHKKYDDATVSPVIRQLMLQWGYELRPKDI